MAAAPRTPRHVKVENPAYPSLEKLVKMLENAQKRTKPERAEDKAKRGGKPVLKAVPKKSPKKTPEPPSRVPDKPPSERGQGSNKPKDGPTWRFFDKEKDNELAGLGPNEKPKPKSPRDERPNREKGAKERRKQLNDGTIKPGDKTKVKTNTSGNPLDKTPAEVEAERREWARQHPDNRGPKPPVYNPPGKKVSKPIPPRTGDMPKLPPTKVPVIKVDTRKIPEVPGKKKIPPLVKPRIWLT